MDERAIALLLQVGSLGVAVGLVVMQVRSLNGTVEKLSARLEALADRVGGHDTKIARLEERIHMAQNP